ncbi:hypothetical protein V6Z12_A07G108300 [Gossypium hirsutum]
MPHTPYLQTNRTNAQQKETKTKNIVFFFILLLSFNPFGYKAKGFDHCNFLRDIHIQKHAIEGKKQRKCI